MSEINYHMLHESTPFDKSVDISPKNGFKVFIGAGTLLEVLNAKHGAMVIVQQAHMSKAEAFEKVSESLYKITGLRPAAMKLFKYLIITKDPDQSMVHFNPRNYALAKNVSIRYAYRLMRELIEKKVMARSVNNHEYFLNCNLVVNPNRITIVEEYIITDDIPEGEFPSMTDKSGW